MINTNDMAEKEIDTYSEILFNFTKSAVELAKKSRIRLWDRDKLLQMVSDMNTQLQNA